MAASVDFTIADVLAWARTKPADGRYLYEDPNNCALCHFLRDTRRARKPAVGPYCSDLLTGYWQEEGGPRIGYVPELEPALVGNSERADWTFGGLVTRLEKLCSETPVTRSDWLSIETYLSVDCGKVPA